MLLTFLQMNQEEILASAESKTLKLAGVRPSSDKLKRGLPIFYQQFLDILSNTHEDIVTFSKRSIAENAKNTEHVEDQITVSAGNHGSELMRLGYNLSDVVNAFGFMCQSITELAAKRDEKITPDEFNELNRCLDMAIASAVTKFQHHMDTMIERREIQHLGFLAHELRNTLTSVNLSVEMIQNGTVGFGGNTAKVLNSGLKRMQNLIDQSLTEVRMRVDPKVYQEKISVLEVVNQIVLTAGPEMKRKEQVLLLEIAPEIFVEADSQLIYSAISNLIQNAIKYTRVGGRIIIRSKLESGAVNIEVEDECGGLSDDKINLFAPFEQQSLDRSGLGLGLTIAKRAVELNHGQMSLKNRPGHGCIFSIALPQNASSSQKT